MKRRCGLRSYVREGSWDVQDDRTRRRSGLRRPPPNRAAPFGFKLRIGLCKKPAHWLGLKSHSSARLRHYERVVPANGQKRAAQKNHVRQAVTTRPQFTKRYPPDRLGPPGASRGCAVGRTRAQASWAKEHLRPQISTTVREWRAKGEVSDRDRARSRNACGSRGASTDPFFALQ